MSKRDGEPRTWALLDRSVPAPPQRRFARQMRSSPTDAERKLWWHLRHRLPVANSHFRKQVRIKQYIVDFACHAARLVVEIDGGQHASVTLRMLSEPKYWRRTAIAYFVSGTMTCLAIPMACLRRFNLLSLSPPPLTPPHKGEGNRPRRHCAQKPDLQESLICRKA